jgi:hypothetical protein
MGTLQLGRRRGRVGQLAVGGGPNAVDALSGANEERCGGQGHEGHEKGVLDKVLPIFLGKEGLEGVVHEKTIRENRDFVKAVVRVNRFCSNS